MKMMIIEIVELVPENHLLRRIDEQIDFIFINEKQRILLAKRQKINRPGFIILYTADKLFIRNKIQTPFRGRNKPESGIPMFLTFKIG